MATIQIKDMKEVADITKDIRDLNEQKKILTVKGIKK